MRAWLSRSDFTSTMISSLSFFVAAFLRGRERIAAQLVLDVLVLQPVQPLVAVGDFVEGLQHLRLELGLDRGERKRVLHVVVVGPGIAGRRRLAALAGLSSSSFDVPEQPAPSALAQATATPAALAGATPFKAAAPERAIDRLPIEAERRHRHRLGFGAGVGGFQVNDVAQGKPCPRSTRRAR
jgi:hypothetical protein